MCPLERIFQQMIVFLSSLPTIQVVVQPSRHSLGIKFQFNSHSVAVCIVIVCSCSRAGRQTLRLLYEYAFFLFVFIMSWRATDTLISCKRTRQPQLVDDLRLIGKCKLGPMCATCTHTRTRKVKINEIQNNEKFNNSKCFSRIIN